MKYSIMFNKGSNKSEMLCKYIKVDICLEAIRLNPSYLYFFLGSTHCASLLDRIWEILPQHQIHQTPSPQYEFVISSVESSDKKWAVKAVNRIADICPGAIRYWQKGITSKNTQKDIQSYCQSYLSQNLIKKELKNVKVNYHRFFL